MDELPHRQITTAIENQLGSILKKRMLFLKFAASVIFALASFTVIFGLFERDFSYVGIGLLSALVVYAIARQSFIKQEIITNLAIEKQIREEFIALLTSRGLSLNESELETLGLLRSWDDTTIGDTLGATISIEKTENSEPRFHSLVAVKTSFDNFSIFETTANARVKLISA